MPSLNEQQIIANFLDHETAKIDTLIEKQQQLIKLLKEKRQAVISHAVTKGLNPNVLMRDSGVEWLGEVPTHWAVYPMRRVIKKFVDYRGKTPENTDEGEIPLITATCVRNGVINHKRKSSYVTKEIYNKWMVRGFPSKGDVVFTTEGATFGETAQIEEENIALAQRLILFKTGENLMDDFLYYFFISNAGFAEHESRQAGTTVFGVSADSIKRSFIIVPPVNEQIEISKYLRSQIFNIDSVIPKAEGLINLLTERRTAIISAAVTGKMDVRNWQASEINNKEVTA